MLIICVSSQITGAGLTQGAPGATFATRDIEARTIRLTSRLLENILNTHLFSVTINATESSIVKYLYLWMHYIGIRVWVMLTLQTLLREIYFRISISHFPILRRACRIVVGALMSYKLNTHLFNVKHNSLSPYVIKYLYLCIDSFNLNDLTH